MPNSKTPTFQVRATVSVNQYLYLNLDVEASDGIEFTFSPKSYATVFTSKVLATGWMLKAQAFFPKYKYVVRQT